MLLSAGDKLGPYEILALAGTDGMGEVCRARDPLVKRDVAIKVSAGQFSERLEREARAVAALNNPTFAPVMTWVPTTSSWNSSGEYSSR
jgi:serine/threonine protein kinase